MFGASNVIDAHDLAPVDDLRFQSKLDSWMTTALIAAPSPLTKESRVGQGRIRGGAERTSSDIFHRSSHSNFFSLSFSKPGKSRGKVRDTKIKPHLPNVKL